MDNIVGNYVILDLGKGIYAIYAHLQPGKIRVHKGEKVKTGETLGLLGNSGNSDEPHLHFQLMDKPSPLGSEGIPFVITHFTQLGIAANTDAMDGGAKWEPRAGSRKQIEAKEEFPVENAVMDFK